MSGLRIFQNREFGAVRVVEYGGEPWFVARDVCAVLGTETRDLPDILEHDEQRPIVDIIHTLNDSTGLRRDSRIISEPGLYSLVLRSRKPEAKAFKRWIVHEVIPSIRRTGGYGALALPNFRNPAEAARAWADKEEQRLLEEQKRLALEQKMEEVRPKVVFAESIEVAKTSILVGEMAKLIKQATGYDIGQNRFFEWLRSRGYLHKDGSQTNMPTQRSMDAGWMEIKEGTRIGSSGKAASPARRRSRARGKSTSSTCSRKWWSHDHPLPPPYPVARGRVPHGGRAQGSRRAISAPAALPEAGMPLAVSDGLREVWRQN
ncbi:MAG: phage antirepressor KilAC domain-containing protein [Bilophila wadsworthia]